MRRILIFMALILAGCIGTDVLEDPIVGERIETTFSQVSLLVDSTARVSATYYDPFGIERNYQLHWHTDDALVASIDQEGMVTAIAPGQTFVRATLNTASSPDILVTVVATADEVGQIILSSPEGTQVEVGSMLSLQTEVLTATGEPFPVADISWMSSDTDVISISNEGVVTGLANGTAMVRAEANGVLSNSLLIRVGNTDRTGTFSDANGYETSGTARLFYAENGKLMLEFADNFETTFALGTFVYLSNSTTGSATAANGLEIAGITTNGYKLFDISSIDSSVSIDSFSHVIILCKPASVTFGYALMQ